MAMTVAISVVDDGKEEVLPLDFSRSPEIEHAVRLLVGAMKTHYPAMTPVMVLARVMFNGLDAALADYAKRRIKSGTEDLRNSIEGFDHE